MDKTANMTVPLGECDNCGRFTIPIVGPCNYCGYQQSAALHESVAQSDAPEGRIADNNRAYENYVADPPWQPEPKRGTAQGFLQALRGVCYKHGTYEGAVCPKHTEGCETFHDIKRDIAIAAQTLPPLSSEQMTWSPDVIAAVKKMSVIELHRSVLACQQVIFEREHQLREALYKLAPSPLSVREQLNADELLAEVMHLWIDGYISKSPNSHADASISNGVFDKVSAHLDAVGIVVDYCGWHRKAIAGEKDSL